MDSVTKKIGEYVSRIRYTVTRRLREFYGRLAFSRTKRMDFAVVAAARGHRFPTLRQLRQIPRTLTRLDRIVLRASAGVIVVGLLLVGYNQWFRNATLLPAPGGEIVEGVVGAPLYINPLFAQGNDVDRDLTSLVFSGLLKYDTNLELVPDLAESFSVSEDQKTYTFTLRKDVHWHDGEPFTASDVVFTYQSILDENYKSPLLRSFAGVTISKSDDTTVIFGLSEPYAAFPHLMTTGILPQHLWYEVPAVTARLNVLNQKPVGTGPFKFKSYVRESNGSVRSYTFEKNKNYYGHVPFIDRVMFRFYPDYLTALDALQNKNVTSIGYLPRDLAEKVAGKKRIALHQIPLAQYTAIFFNGDRNEALKDKTVRQALAYATDESAITDQVLHGNGAVVTGPILPGFPGYSEQKKYDYNPQKAAQMLLDSGWKLDGEVLKKGSTPLEITLTIVDQGEYPAVAEAIRQSWRQIGAKVTIETVSKTQIEKDKIIPRDYQALLYGAVIGADPDPYPFWHSSQRIHPGVNLTSYGNRKADELLEQARQTNDEQKRSDLYTAFQGIIAEEVPAIFIYSPLYAYPVSSSVQGIGVERVALPSDRLIGIDQWYIHTTRVYQ